MHVIAATLGVAFGAIGALPYVPLLSAPQTERRSGTPLAVPRPARLLWVACNIAIALAAFSLVLNATAPALLVLTAAGIAVCALAVANGYWIKGRPTLSHHVVRAALVTLVIGTAALSVYG